MRETHRLYLGYAEHSQRRIETIGARLGVRP